MAIEEPSVIAACSAIAKIISEKGSGFKATSTLPIMIAQVSILDLADIKAATYALKQNKKAIVNHAN